MLDQALASGLDELGIQLTRETQEKLLEYLALVRKWNRTYNLTAVREPQQMLTHHVLDSLAAVPHLPGKRIIDVGSGAGLPGIPLALAMPAAQISLVESNHKKHTFLQQALIELSLKNAEAVNVRVEAWDTPRRFDVVISRAFSDLAEFVTLAGRLCAADGVIVAMKGVYPYEELAQLPQGYRVEDVIPLHVPGMDAERHLVRVRPV
jgi:16S rRNA (guanine527-N7)-methyltransferase